MLRHYIFRFFLRLGLSVLSVTLLHGAVTEKDIEQRIARGENFLTNLFDARLDLLPEYQGSSTYWLFHDNYLAAHLLAKSRPDLSERIRSTLVKFGITNSGKIEIVFGETAHPLPFRTYGLTNAA